jgi:hypothetical protein
MKDGSKYWGQRIPGEGKKKYTDLISSAIIAEDADLCGATKDDLIAYTKIVNGTPNSAKPSRVTRIRPLLRPWKAKAILNVFDARLTLPVLKTVLIYSGTYKGLCDWRPNFGRFTLKSIEAIQ